MFVTGDKIIQVGLEMDAAGVTGTAARVSVLGRTATDGIGEVDVGVGREASGIEEPSEDATGRADPGFEVQVFMVAWGFAHNKQGRVFVGH